MTIKEYRRAIDHWDMTQIEFAAAFDMSRRTCQNYASGSPIPFTVAALIRLMRNYDLTPADLKGLT